MRRRFLPITFALFSTLVLVTAGPTGLFPSIRTDDPDTAEYDNTLHLRPGWNENLLDRSNDDRAVDKRSKDGHQQTLQRRQTPPQSPPQSHQQFQPQSYQHTQQSAAPQGMSSNLSHPIQTRRKPSRRKLPLPLETPPGASKKEKGKYRARRRRAQKDRDGFIPENVRLLPVEGAPRPLGPPPPQQQQPLQRYHTHRLPGHQPSLPPQQQPPPPPPQQQQPPPSPQQKPPPPPPQQQQPPPSPGPPNWEIWFQGGDNYGGPWQ